MMKSLITTALFVVAAIAAPNPAPEAEALPQGKIGGCKKVAFLFARGSTETGTMGITVGMVISLDGNICR
jgi:hypothetical protein